MWYKTQRFPSLEHPIVSQQPTQPLVDQVVEPISYLVDPTLPLESDFYHVIEQMLSLVNPTLPFESDIHKAVESIPSSINPTLILEIEVSVSHIFFTTS